MLAGQPRLAIDYGTVATVAVLAWPDGRWTPLQVDGTTVLSSAVLVADNGDLITGAAAWQQAAVAPTRFVLAPLRAGTGTMLVDGVEVAVRDLVTATLRRVVEEAARMAGGPVADVRLVVPAGWGPRRRTWLRQAAHAAGLGQPSLVEAPVAAADQVVSSGVQFPVGAFLLVCDVGGGCEVTVLRRGPTGFEVLSTLADPDAGGSHIDELLTATTGFPAPMGETGPDERSTAAPEPPPAGESVGERWTVLAALQAGKEALSQYPAVTVPLPPPAPAMVLTTAMLDEVTRPVMARIGALIEEAIAAAEITAGQLSAVYAIGAAAVTPALTTQLTTVLGGPPIPLQDPAVVAVCGAAQVGGPGNTATVSSPVMPVPPVRRVVAVVVPGVASLVLLAHCLFTAQYSSYGRASTIGRYYVDANWGELAMAAVCAVLACVAGGSMLGVLLGRAEQTRPDRAPTPVTPAGQVATGIVAAAATGVAIAGLYAVAAATYFAWGLGSPLRWTVYPAAGVAVFAVVVAVIAARWQRVPVQGWDGYLAFPMEVVITATLGMVLVQYSMSAERWPSLALYIDLAGRVGGLLIGIATACALTRIRTLRLIAAVPLGLFLATIVSPRTTGVLATIFIVAVWWWWTYRVWALIRTPRQTAAHYATFP